MAVPELADAQPFYLLDPATLTVPPTEAATIPAATTGAPKLSISELKPVDLCRPA